MLTARSASYTLHIMSCCRDSASEDVVLYRKLDDVVSAIAADPQRFVADLSHPVKGPKLRRLLDTLRTLAPST